MLCCCLCFASLLRCWRNRLHQPQAGLYHAWVFTAYNHRYPCIVGPLSLARLLPAGADPGCRPHLGNLTALIRGTGAAAAPPCRGSGPAGLLRRPAAAQGCSAGRRRERPRRLSSCMHRGALVTFRQQRPTSSKGCCHGCGCQDQEVHKERRLGAPIASMSTPAARRAYTKLPKQGEVARKSRTLHGRLGLAELGA